MEQQVVLTYHNPNVRIGFHIGKLKTIRETFEVMTPTPLRGYQLYTSNSRSYNTPKVDVADLLEARKLLERNGKYAVQHGSLLHNLCGSVKGQADPAYQRKLEGTCRCLLGELDVGVALGSGVVVHTGSCQNRKFGIHSIARSIEYVLTQPTPNAKALAKAMNISLDDFLARRVVILENAAGEGSKLGSNLTDLADIYAELKPAYHDQVKVCFDTAHSFGAGQYDFGLTDEVQRFYDEFEATIGLDKLSMFHLNDSRVGFGSKKDRHENLCLGEMFRPDRGDEKDGTLGLTEFLKRAEEHKIMLIGEPPAKDKDGGAGMGGRWDYRVIRDLCPLEKDVPVC